MKLAESVTLADALTVDEKPENTPAHAHAVLSPDYAPRRCLVRDKACP